MNDKTPSPAAQPAAADDALTETPEFKAWRERDRLFWGRHQEIMRIQGVLGICISNKPLPLTITLDNTAELPHVRQQVRDLFADIGLTLGDLRFEQKNPPQNYPLRTPRQRM